MKKNRFSEEQIIGEEAGAKVADLAHKYGVSEKAPPNAYETHGSGAMRFTGSHAFHRKGGSIPPC